MSEQSSAVPAGWYPDPDAPGGQRWWDGQKWTDYVGRPMPAPQPFEQPKAPEGTRTGTVWIWLVALMPLVSLPVLFLIDIEGYLRGVMANPASVGGMMSLYVSPGYLIAILLGWGSTIASIVFCYLDWRTLRARGVPSPFHWAFGLLTLAGAGIVYPIGRSLVVRRCAGGSVAPMVVAIVVYAVVLIVSLVWLAVVMSQVFAMIPGYVSS